MLRRASAVLPILILALLFVGCAATRVAEMGILPNEQNLVTLVVSEDREIVAKHCQGALALGPIYGCQITRISPLPDGKTVRLIKIVRYTDSIPSPMALEIDVHELCHAVASLQAVKDPCHVGNGGFLQHAPRTTQIR